MATAMVIFSVQILDTNTQAVTTWFTEIGYRDLIDTYLLLMWPHKMELWFFFLDTL